MLKRLSLGGLFLGLLLLIAVIAWSGVGTITATVAGAGWGALVLLPVMFIVPLVLSTASWALLFPQGDRPPASRLALVNWYGFGINWLLPVARVGGEVVRGVLIARRGSSPSSAIASVVVDKTLQFAVQPTFALLGVGLLLARGAEGKVITLSVLGVAIIAALFVGVVLIQRFGFRPLLPLFVRTWQRLRRAEAGDGARRASEVVEAVEATYRRRGALLGAAVLRFAFRGAFTAEVYVGMHLLGHPVSLTEALIMESISQGARAAMFLIPGGIGAQEGAFALVAVALGLSPEIGVSISLVKRARELVVGLPALLVWQFCAVRGGGSHDARAPAHDGGTGTPAS